ncbi:MAG: ion transporter [Candidatus Andeanibacterium colombiense]|uniref:Ion transporter n=1 Tax=Candidatus Andeanibacterium colombiense TaxID=3121345 RepID=A0AAJ6BPR9_9SPHN|nr:MAG: ion transporter [Sphingomonadaceae bacterium]
MPPFRKRVYHSLFEGTEHHGRLSKTNLVLVVVILAAITVSIIGTERSIAHTHHDLLIGAEMGFGLVFLAEYVVRLWCIPEKSGPGSATAKRLRYAFSPLALIDLFVVVISLIPFFIGNGAILRVVRLARLAALVKFNRFSHAVEEISEVIWERRYELAVTIGLGWVVLLFGATALYWAEGDVQPEKFGSIPRALWWAIVTLTTVGYGDAVPITPLGKGLASLVALSGIVLVAMPAGIMAAAFSEAMQKRREREIAAHIEAEVERKVDAEVDRLAAEEDRLRRK